MALHQFQYPIVPLRDMEKEPTLDDVLEEAMAQIRDGVGELTEPLADIAPFLVMASQEGIDEVAAGAQS